MHAVNQLQHDLRERERQINRARQEQFHREKMAAVGSLAAQLAHEINNPIAAITGVASSIDSIRQSDQCQFLGSHACEPGLILEQARRISAITRQIADFTRPQPSHAELIDVNQIIRSTCSFVSYDRRFRGIALNTELDGDLPAIHAVADHISQVLMNVLINAADALEEMPAGHSGVIAVTTRTDADGVVIEVADNGKGIDAATLERVFDEYFTTKPAGKGTGLGLALSRELVQDAGGTITLSSTPGSGTTVRVSLPQRLAEHAALVRAGA
jgi:signal transduction histidine kinase